MVATIHQPNSLITDSFDDWALLAQGRLLYSGAWSGAVGYFEAAGYACPMYRCAGPCAFDHCKQRLICPVDTACCVQHTCEGLMRQVPLPQSLHDTGTAGI